ncbi:MAG TPA: hypothetical protein VFO10_27650 [Oligoflexus sp.]|uniref:hypothetical protein n=1 Tax=Oligoflexus sp. TaxID=1971216 RepID=UPI002D7FC794|nr:hypothetical protein [Oligoflexus sp.]HET9241071.1 hypothetical protein [Oligoflexus sp.]
MIFNRTAVCLSSIVSASLLIHACQAEVIQDSRSTTNGATAQSASKADDAKTEDKTSGSPTGNTTPPPANNGNPAAVTNYTMSWDASADAAVVSYKVFVVPPDRNPRFPGKTDVPIQIKNYPLASLQKNGTKYSVAVTSDEVKTALGAMAASTTTYCFTVVAVNGVGNSAHSPVICP